MSRSGVAEILGEPLHLVLERACERKLMLATPQHQSSSQVPRRDESVPRHGASPAANVDESAVANQTFEPRSARPQVSTLASSAASPVFSAGWSPAKDRKHSHTTTPSSAGGESGPLEFPETPDNLRAGEVSGSDHESEEHEGEWPELKHSLDWDASVHDNMLGFLAGSGEVREKLPSATPK